MTKTKTIITIEHTLKEILHKLSEDDIKSIEIDENNFKKYDFLLKLFDKADIINQLNLSKIN